MQTLTFYHLWYCHVCKKQFITPVEKPITEIPLQCKTSIRERIELGEKLRWPFDPSKAEIRLMKLNGVACPKDKGHRTQFIKNNIPSKK